MQTEDDLRGLSLVTDFMRGISFLFLAVHLYWFCYGFLHQQGLIIGVVDTILLKFQRATGLFTHLWTTKLFCMLFLGLSCMGNHGMKSEKIKPKHIGLTFSIGIILFWSNFFILDLNSNNLIIAVWYTLTLVTGFLGLLMSGLWVSRLIGKGLNDDPFNDENESFMQELRLLENEYSINLPTEFRYKGKKWQG